MSQSDRPEERAHAGSAEPDVELCAWVRTAFPGLNSLEPMAGGAGARRYWRAQSASGERAVCMQGLPEDPGILPPALRQPERFAFLEMTRWLAERDFPVPRILACEPEQRWLLLEDLGTTHLLDLAPAAREDAYRRAVELLARLHALPEAGPTAELPYSRRFDPEWIGFELGLFAQRVPGRAHAETLRALEQLAQYIAALPVRVCLRDFQSHNLMIDPSGALRILDYQDCLLAPPELDLASLLHDSYVDLGPEQREALLRHYEGARGQRVPREALAALVVQRKCKDWSRFRLLIERGDARYRGADTRAVHSIRWALSELPASLEPVADALWPCVGELES